MKILLFLFLASCVALPHTPPRPRTAWAADFMTVRVDMSCSESNPLDPGMQGDIKHQEWPDIDWGGHSGTGVIISERHVLTAAHVVRCPILPTVRVTLSDGRRFQMVVTRDEAMFGDGTDIARLEIATAEQFGVGIPPPELASPAGDEWCAHLTHETACGPRLTATTFQATARPGDSGAGVYGGTGVYAGGKLVGLVVGGTKHTTTVVRVDASWLEGT